MSSFAQELWRTVAYFPSGTGGPENDVMGDFWLWQPEQCGVLLMGTGKRDFAFL